MSETHPVSLDSTGGDPALAELVDRVTDTLLAGQDVDPSELVAAVPQHAARIRSMLPALRALADLRGERSSGAVGSMPGGTDRAELFMKHGAAGDLDTPRPVELPGLEDFRVVREIGRGGMGVVYEAQQLSLRRRVALKILPWSTMPDQRRVHRFEREARAVARLRHPHIVTIYEVGTCALGPYYAMEYIEGNDLATVARRQAMSPKAAAACIRDIARAVQAAHDAGVLHRDLKPANILVDSEGTPHVTDFGLSKEVDGGDSQATATGAVLGTPSYMPQEQALGRTGDIGPHSDVYSLGATLYELLTGRPPFRAETAALTLQQVIHNDPPSPRLVSPGVPRDLETICLKCLSKETGRRYATAAALAQDLEAFLEGRSIKARPVGSAERAWRWCRRKPAAASAIALGAVLTIAVAWFGLRLQEARSETQAKDQIAIAEKRLRLLNEVREWRVAGSPGWTWRTLANLREVLALGGGDDLELSDLRSEVAACLGTFDLREHSVHCQDESAYCVAFAPDSRHLAVGQWRTEGLNPANVWLVDVTTGSSRNLRFAPGAEWYERTDRPDGARVLAFDGHRLYVGTRSGWVHCWDTANDAPAPAMSWWAHTEEIYALLPLEDGHALITDSKDCKIKRWQIAGEGKIGATLQAQWPKPANPNDGEDHGLTLSRDGKELLVSATPVSWLDARTLRPLREGPKGVAFNHPVSSADGSFVWGFSNTDDIASFDSQTGVRRDILVPSHLRQGDRGDFVRSSPDGSVLVTRGNDRELKFWDAANGQRLGVVTIDSGQVYPALSPDGRLLAVTLERGVKVFELRSLDESHVSYSIAHQSRPILAMSISPERPTIVCVAPTESEPPGWLRSAAVSVWNAGDGAHQHRWPCEIGRDASLAFHPRGSTAVIASSLPDAVAGVGFPKYRLDLSPPAFRQEGGFQNAHALKFAPDGQLLWHLDCYCPNHVVVNHTWPQFAEMFSFDNRQAEERFGTQALLCLDVGKRFAVAGANSHHLLLFSLETNDPAPRWKSLTTKVLSVALAPDESWLAAGLADGRIEVLSLPNLDSLATVYAHDHTVQSLVFAPDGILVSGSEDRTIRLWQRSGRGLQPLLVLRHPSPVRTVCLGPSGTHLAVLGKDDRGVRVWRLADLTRALGDMGIAW